MSRSDIPDIKDRRPFYLYVDEFQNFATDSFATILSEARKYGLNLTVANQYISQMSDTVRNAVFGNVGTMITFRVSADDSPILAKQFEPQFEANDLLQMHNRNFVINMVINGEKTPAFSARTLNLPPAQTDNTTQIIEHTRKLYSRSREVVEAEISELIQPGGAKKAELAAPAPVSAAIQKQWPINAQGNTITPNAQQPAQTTPAAKPTQEQPKPKPQAPAAPAVAPQQAGEAGEGGEGAKKKRKRRKRKKSGEGGGEGSLPPVATGNTNEAPKATPPAPQTPAQPAEKPLPTKEGHEAEIRLR